MTLQACSSTCIRDYSRMDLHCNLCPSALDLLRANGGNEVVNWKNPALGSLNGRAIRMLV